MSDSGTKEFLLTLGKNQVDAIFRRQEAHAIDDSEFLPLLEVVLTAFETTGSDADVAEEVWEYAFAVYDRACKEADPRFTTADNRKPDARASIGATGPETKVSKMRRLSIPSVPSAAFARSFACSSKSLIQ